MTKDEGDGRCYLCRVQDHEIIYTNDHWIAIANPDSVIPGQLILMVNRHCEHIAQLTLTELTSLGPAIASISLALSQVFYPKKVYINSFCEDETHLHFMINARLSWMPSFTSSLLLGYLQKLGKTYTQQELNWFAEQLKSRLYIKDEI